MKSLFSEVKKTPTAAGAFKFAFKLGGDEDLQHDDPAVGSKTKKNKKKKKKKATSAGVAKDDEDDAEEVEDGAVADVDVQVQLSALSIAPSTETAPAPHSTVDAPTGIEAEAALSKSQKKNKKRAKAKAASGNCEPESTAPAPVGKGPPATKKADASAAQQAQPQKSSAKELPKLSQLGNSKPKSSVPAADDFDFDAEVAAAIAHNKTLAPAKPAKTASPSKGSKNSSTTAPSSSGPIYLSSKDPELDEAARQLCRFGRGKNLVAIGPAKVRGSNWLLAPPGLTLGSGAQAGAGIDGAGVSEVKAGSLGGAFAKKAVTPVKSSIAQQQQQNMGSGTEVSHSSPFSFSFNGL